VHAQLATLVHRLPSEALQPVFPEDTQVLPEQSPPQQS
jgi:hypothetical protein